jgi:hypothetical protein
MAYSKTVRVKGFSRTYTKKPGPKKASHTKKHHKHKK